jgi:hypothetical protein
MSEVSKYIDSVEGNAHQSAVQIIAKLEAENKRLRNGLQGEGWVSVEDYKPCQNPHVNYVIDSEGEMISACYMGDEWTDENGTAIGDVVWCLSLRIPQPPESEVSK